MFAMKQVLVAEYCYFLCAGMKQRVTSKQHHGFLVKQSDSFPILLSVEWLYTIIF